jgi:hypothetical protein
MNLRFLMRSISYFDSKSVLLSSFLRRIFRIYFAVLSFFTTSWVLAMLIIVLVLMETRKVPLAGPVGFFLVGLGAFYFDDELLASGVASSLPPEEDVLTSPRSSWTNGLKLSLFSLESPESLAFEFASSSPFDTAPEP